MDGRRQDAESAADPPRVSIVVPAVSDHVLGAANMLTRALERDFPVQIVGADLGHGVCPPYDGVRPYDVVDAPRLYRVPDYFRERARIAGRVSGDVVIAMKASAATVPVALAAKRARGAAALAYLDEWDGALWAIQSPGEKLSCVLRHWHHPLEDLYAPRMERRLKRFDRVLCSSRALARRFDGTVVPWGVDTERFKSGDEHARRALRSSLGIPETARLVVFGGVVRPHKGVELILDALVRTGRPDLALLVVGPENDHVKALRREGGCGGRLFCTGDQPWETMPRFLDLAEVIVVPLTSNALAETQVPCKVFEAMAMAKPVIASRVSDLPEVLDGCGLIVEPGSSAALAAALTRLLDDAAFASRLGEAAREVCCRSYSAAVTEEIMVRIVRDAWAAVRSAPRRWGT